MATMNFSIPDDVKEAFNATFKDENKSAVVTELMRRAIEQRSRAKRESLVEQMRRMRVDSPGFTSEQIRKAREEGRP